MPKLADVKSLSEFKQALIDQGLAEDEATAHQITIEVRKHLNVFGAPMKKGRVIYHSGVSNILASSYGQKLFDCFQKLAQLTAILSKGR